MFCFFFFNFNFNSYNRCVCSNYNNEKTFINNTGNNKHITITNNDVDNHDDDNVDDVNDDNVDHQIFIIMIVEF